ncbi:integrase [Rhizobium skierniewicense]|uniref:Integrase n=1 Tax=Rhizobium skierniewicense TaxID=984260 RepID=A0A7W6G2M3_9HYPH|nr:site-specific integrase [Rhizobium skierniewicense]MBB3946970.1 integrase [Rhizobium skierniewicense]
METLPSGFQELRLPKLPKRLSYYDDFACKERIIEDIEGCDTVRIMIGGDVHCCNLQVFGDAAKTMRVVISEWVRKVKPTTATIQFAGMTAFVRECGNDKLKELILLDPLELARCWNFTIKPFVTYEMASAIRSFLHVLASNEIAHWRPCDAVRIRHSIRSPAKDRFAKIRAGASYLRQDEQSRVVNYLDHFSAEVSDTTALAEVIQAALLVLGFQHGLRPGQSARLLENEMEFFDDGTMHITVPYLKQPRGTVRRVSIRSIKKEWVSIFRELSGRNKRNLTTGGTESRRYLLRLTPRQVTSETSQALASLAIERSATDLRHTAAQRLADNGATAAQIMDFLCQTSGKIAQLYIDASPSQGKIINDALGLSPFHQDLPAKHASRFLTKEELLALQTGKRRATWVRYRSSWWLRQWPELVRAQPGYRMLRLRPLHPEC